MRENVTEAQLCLDGPGGFTYVLGLVRYTLWEDESFRYELEPDYAVIDLLGAADFPGIPGFDLSARKPRYERANRTPTLIAERAPMENREDLWQLLEGCGMAYWDPLEWLIRTPTRYIGDDLYFRAVPPLTEALEVEEAIARAASSRQGAAAVLRALCEGREVIVRSARLSPSDRKALYGVLLPLHEKMGRGKAAAGERVGTSVRPGRKRKSVDELMLREAVERYRSRQWTAAAAAESLGVSVPTFYRRLAEWEDRDATVPAPV